ncbi:DUF3124 domain-containing protein [Desulfopila sp. IMCC35006]|uniref:DUF3124 domain-containing protein n=1 Tax=Desulfopila sp. IMCC35006 TaxID=2569542 RepID=UPI0010ACA502|nr:DUF3124 domain-containing protein [Desulfopila sp. IMCC35006]TKB26934.1 DUF3124 domain-containing protein [Desulfopila sp. IMCC35006]
MRLYLLVFFLVLLFQTPSLQAADPSPLTKGQMVYVPAYSNIYHGNKEDPLLLAVTLSIRNVDPNNSLTITAVNYHETQGPLVKKYIKAPIILGPLGSERFIVAQRDDTGGSGANFIVEWRADKPINPPIIESVMIGTQSQLGISFTSRGQAIQ